MWTPQSQNQTSTKIRTMFGVYVCIVALLFQGLQPIDSAPSKPCILLKPLMVDKWFTTQGRLMSFGRGYFTTVYKAKGHVQVKRSPKAYETHCLSDRKVQLRFKYSEGHFQCLTLTMIRRGLLLVEKIEDRAVVNDVIDCQDNRFSTTRDVEQFVLSRYMPKGVKYGRAKCWTPFTSGSSKTAVELFIQSKMKFPDCMRTCVALGYRIFGFLNGSSCICAHDTEETFEIIAGSSEQAMKMCQVPCRGQRTSAYPTSCGGTDHISTYSVETVENEANFRYEDDVGGCWADVNVPGRHRQLTATVFMSPALCVRFCSSHGFLYAATSVGRVCTCRNTYGMLGKGRRCTAKCVGEQGANDHGYCGNVNRPYLHNVYQVMQFSSDTVKRRMKPELRGTWYTSTVPQNIVQVYKRKIVITEKQPEEGSVGMETAIGTDEILDISPKVTRVRYFWVSEGEKYHVCLTFVMSDDNRTVDVTYVEASTDRFNNPCALRSRNPDLRWYSQFAISRSPLPQKMEYTEAGCYLQDRAVPVMYEAARHDNTGANLGECARYCYVKQLPYFAIMSGRLCYCGYGGQEEVLDSGCLEGCGMTNSPCKKTSPGNMFTMKMYKIDQALFSKLTTVGCFNLVDFMPQACAIEPLSQLDRCKLEHTSSEMMSPALCAHLCPKGMKYIHVYQRSKCHCGETLEDSPTLPLETCDTPCPGDINERCGGGETFVSVYRMIPRERTLLSKQQTLTRAKRHRRAARSGGHVSPIRRKSRATQTEKLVRPVPLTTARRPIKFAGPGKPVKAIKRINPTMSAKQSKAILSRKHAQHSRADNRVQFVRHRMIRDLFHPRGPPPWRKWMIKGKRRRIRLVEPMPVIPKQRPVAKTTCPGVYGILRKGIFHTSPWGDRIVDFKSGYKFETFIGGSKRLNMADPINNRTGDLILSREAEKVTCYSETTMRLLVRYEILTACLTFQIISEHVIEVENIQNDGDPPESQLCSRHIRPSRRVVGFVLSRQPENDIQYGDKKCHDSSRTDTALLRSRKFHIMFMTMPACLRTCLYLGYAYIGMLKGATCICFHDEYETFGTTQGVGPGKEMLCAQPCEGHVVKGYPHHCGGKRNILSFSILGRKNPPNSADIQDIGCYADEYDARSTPIWTGKRPLPLESCLDFCSNMGTLYATISSRNLCSCVNHFGRLGLGKGCLTCSSTRIKRRSWECGSNEIPYYHSVYIVTRYPPEAMKKTIPKYFRGFWYTDTSPRHQLIIYENSIFLRNIPDVSKRDDVFYMTSRNIISPSKYVLLIRDLQKPARYGKPERNCFVMIRSKDGISAEITHIIFRGRLFRYPCHNRGWMTDRLHVHRYAMKRVPLPPKVGYKYIGCYFYNRYPIFSIAPQINYLAVDKPACARFCQAQDYQTFFITYKRRCYCGDGLSEKVLDDGCKARCGKTADPCFGNKTELKIPAEEYRIDGTYVMLPVFRGCFLVGDAFQAMCDVTWTAKKVPCLIKKESPDAMQPRLCANLCYPHKHFYIYKLTRCYCDMGDLKMPKRPDKYCKPCLGDVRASCGASIYMSGYASHGSRTGAQLYASPSPPPLPLYEMEDKEAWKKPNVLFKDFFTSLDQITKWKEYVPRKAPTFVPKPFNGVPVVVIHKRKQAAPKTTKAPLYGNMHRFSCKQIPEEIQNHKWWSSMGKERQIVFRKLHYETYSNVNNTHDPFHGVWKTTPKAYEKRCYSNLKIRLKFKFSWRFSQCMTLTVLRPTLVKVQLINHWYMTGNPLDCTHISTNKDRKVYEMELKLSRRGNRGPVRHRDKVDGCWVDRYVPERHVRRDVPSPTPESCTMYCSKRGFLYAAVSSGKKCTCMNDYELFGSGENPKACEKVPYLASVYRIIDFDDDRWRQVISPQFQGVWFTSTAPYRQIVIYEYQVFSRTLPAVTEPDDMELIEADEILQISENLLRIRQHWSQNGKDHHACMIIEMAKHGNTAFGTYVLANTNRATNPCFMREKEKFLVNFSQFAMSRRPVAGDVGHKLMECYYMDLSDPIMYSAVMYNNEDADQSECARFCYVTGLPYAGIMLEKYCYCGYGALEKVKDSRCLVRCGKTTTSCHHKILQTKMTMQLFRVGGVPLPVPPSVGCFQLTTLLRHQCGINALQQSTDCYMMTSYNDFTSPILCAHLCRGHKGFIYILNRYDCYCSSKELHIVKVDEEKCDQICTDAQDLRCGGVIYMSVYKNSPPEPPAWNNDGPSTPPLPFTDMRKHMSSASLGGNFTEYFEKLDEITKLRQRNSGRDSDTGKVSTYTPYFEKLDESTERPKRYSENLPLRQEAADDKMTGSGRDSDPGEEEEEEKVGVEEEEKNVPVIIPELRGDSGEVLIQAGRGASLTCYDDHNPPRSGNLTFHWMKGDLPVTDSRFTLTPDGELTLRHAELGDSAEYSCEVKGQDEDDNPVNDKVNKTLIVFLLPDTRYLVRLKYHMRQCDGRVATKKMEHARETLCTSTPCPFVHFQAHCHSHLNAARMREELWLSLTIEPSSDFVAPECELECMEKATVKHLQQELHLVKHFISAEKKIGERGTPRKLSTPTIMANETVKQLVQGCPAGFIPAQKVCTPCHPGTYTNEKIKECHPCKEGFYQPNYGSYKCYKCPGGSSKGPKGAISEDSCLNVGGFTAAIGVIGGSSVAALVVVIAASVIVYRYTSLCRKPRSKSGIDGEKPITVEGTTSEYGDVPVPAPRVPRRLNAQPFARSSTSADSIDVDSPRQHPALATTTSSRVRSRSYSHGSVPLGDTYSSRGSSHVLGQRHSGPFGSRQMVRQPHAAGNPNYGPTLGVSSHPSNRSQLHDIGYAGGSYDDYGMYTDVQLMVPDVPPRHRSRLNTNENHVGELGRSSVYAPGHGRIYPPDAETYQAGKVYNTGAHGPSQYDDTHHQADQTFRQY